MSDIPDVDDGFPPVQFNLRNTGGESTTVSLHQHTLGLDLYLLVRPGDKAIKVEGSHLGMDEVAGILAVLLATTLQSDLVGAETRAAAAELVQLALEDS